MHDDWNEQQARKMREVAVKQSRKLHTKRMDVLNANPDDEEFAPETVEVDKVLEDADKIYQFIKNHEKGL